MGFGVHASGWLRGRGDVSGLGGIQYWWGGMLGTLLSWVCTLHAACHCKVFP
jgi:hypothetical protein